MARHFSGQRLRDIRKAAGISTEQLAISIGRSAYSIHEYQRGRVTPPTGIIVAIADTLGCTIDDLLTEEAANAA